ncbi:prickle-like protein 4 [Tenrec ecaudatus]|uniref:prickle-like protein 4 n=1 Tax=Tenrec ecaudatus TaxID=94439 RepID=UPI003F590F65
MSVPNWRWPHTGGKPTLRESGPPADSDSDSDHLPQDTSAQGPAVLSSGHPHLDPLPAVSQPALRALLQQLPPQDGDERYCLALGEEELAGLRRFCVQRRREALGQGVARPLPPKLEGCTCEKCRQQLRPGEYCVFAARAGEQRCWHQPCFVCQACGQALINLIYFYHDGRLYCGRHHAELLWPRCPACDQLIFSRRCTEAEGQRWHKNHFCCQDCAEPLGGGRYALPGGGPCCPSCFESRYWDAGSSSAQALEGRAPLAPAPQRARVPSLASRSSLRVPGRSAPRAFGAHPAPRLGLRRRARSRAGAAGALRWAEAGRAGSPGALRRTLRPRSTTGGTEPEDRAEGRGCALASAGTNLRAALAAAASCSAETPRGRPGCRPREEGPAGDVVETPSDPKEDLPCPTCSSSSDSEPDGFFLGQRLPRRPGEPPGGGLPAAGGSGPSGKPCVLC